jgi:hypothetical protein
LSGLGAPARPHFKTLGGEVDIEGVRFLRAFLLAFFGSLAWFIWAAADETSGSCFGSSHYVPSAATTLAIVVAAQVAIEAVIWSSGGGRTSERRAMSYIASGAIATAGLMAAGLLIGGFFAEVIGCSA